MKIGLTEIQDTYAEGFTMRYCRLIISAHDDHWLRAAVSEVSGYGSSVIGCDAEVGVEAWLNAAETPDGRLGAAVMLFGFSTEALASSVPNRVAQCVMTCPTTAVFNAMPDTADTVPLGKYLRYFGDGFQKSKLIAGRRYWRIPVMEGEFLVEETCGVAKGVAGGNIVIQAATSQSALDAAKRAVDSVAILRNVVTPFPGGVARSGSKVGSRYKGLKASTADNYCPTLRGRVDSALHPQANAALEIVINGTDHASVSRAMAHAAHAAAGPDILAIGAGNYGGKLGSHYFGLREVVKDEG